MRTPGIALLSLVILLIPSQLSAQRAYENSKSGLKHMVEDGLKLAKQNDQAKLTALTSMMVMPNAASWFVRVFGPDTGGTYSQTYLRSAEGTPAMLAHTFADMLHQGFTGVDVVRFTDACSDDADENEYPVLVSRQEPEALSVVTFYGRQNSQILGYFAYFDGGFRFLGNLQPYPTPAGTAAAPNSGDAANSPPNRIEIGPNVQAARRIKYVPPDYPQYATRQNIQGDVTLNVLISKEGEVIDLRVAKGRCDLSMSAIAAVRQWRYSPTLENGTPVEVRTSVTVNFRLGPRLPAGEEVHIE